MNFLFFSLTNKFRDYYWSKTFPATILFSFIFVIFTNSIQIFRGFITYHFNYLLLQKRCDFQLRYLLFIFEFNFCFTNRILILYMQPAPAFWIQIINLEFSAFQFSTKYSFFIAISGWIFDSAFSIFNSVLECGFYFCVLQINFGIWLWTFFVFYFESQFVFYFGGSDFIATVCFEIRNKHIPFCMSTRFFQISLSKKLSTLSTKL